MEEDNSCVTVTEHWLWAPALVLLQPCQRKQNLGLPGMGTKRSAPAQYGHSWKKLERRRQGGLQRVGKQGLLWQGRKAAPPLLLLCVADGHYRQGCDQTTGCSHLLSPVPLSQSVVSAQHDKWAPCHLLTGVWELPKIMGRSSILPGQGLGPQMSSWHQALSGHVTVGRMMVVAPTRVVLVTWFAQDEALVTGREIWAGQSWCEAGKALGRLERVSHVDKGWLPHMLTLLSLTATAPERATDRSWHLSVLSLLHHSAGEHCRELVLGHQPKLQEKHISSFCTTSWSYGWL